MTEEAAEQQAQRASQRVLQLWALYEAGQITRPDAEASMGLAVYVGKLLASRLADISVSTKSNRPPVGVVPGEHHIERLEEAVSTVLEDTAEDAHDPAERLERLALSETLHSHRASLHAAIRQQGFSHWERVVQSGACEVCAPLAGDVQPVSVGFRDHPGCRCSLKAHGEPVSVSESESEPESRPLVTIRRTA